MNRHNIRTYAPRRHLRPLALAAAVAVAAGLLSVTPAAAATGATVQITDPGFTTTGSWPSSTAIGPDGAPTRYSSSTGASAMWTFVADEAGIYRAEAAIPDVANSETGTIYTLSGGSGGPTATTVDQQATRGIWAQLGWVELEAGDTATLVVSRQATTTGTNTRAGSARLVPDASGTVPPPLDTGLPYSDAWSTGLGGWTPVSGSLDDWSIESTEVDALAIENLTANAGNYVRPTAAIELPADYRIRTSVRIDQFAGGNVSVLIDMLSPYSHVAGNTAVQFIGTGVKLARPNSGAAICNGPAPIATGEWFQLEIVRAAGILAVYTNGELVATATAGGAGGTIGLGAYRADAAIGGIGIEELSGAPTGHPTAATGCSWVPSTGATAAQPIIVNQTGFDLGAPKRFTAPHALDGEAFRIVDADDAVVYEGTVTAQLGDFSDFEPASAGPYRILIDGDAGEGESYDFGIGANWTERISYDHAVGFMSDARCFFGELAGKPLNGTNPQCMLGLGWRDSHQMSFELPALVDLYFANPSAIAAITMPDAIYNGVQYPTTADAPEIARLISWGAEIYLRGQYDHVFLKEQLASFLWAYPELSEWISVDLYEDVRDYLFPIWSQASFSRYSWHDYTSHTADLTQVYTQIGTGKGEFPPGHSIIPNLRMAEVAEREGRGDADVYRNAAIAQAEWIVDNVDVSDPAVTKGQRQAEYVLMTSLATLAASVPASEVPSGVSTFAAEWASVVIERSDNMWDFRRFSDTRWTIPSFTGGGSGADPNESGNILGFPAAAHAAASLIDDDSVIARLDEVAQAHIDNVFGRNPTGRAAQYRVNDPAVAFGGLDLGWFSEYQGGYGLLQGSQGVFDGSPKNGHYPFNPEVQNIGHTEGWVTFTTAWLESLAWRAMANTAIEFDAASAPLDGTASVTLRAPLNMDAAGGNTGEVRVSVNGEAATVLTVTQAGVNAVDYTAELDFGALGVVEGDAVTVSYGLGSFMRSASLAVTAADDGGPGGGTEPPTTVPDVVDPADADPAVELDAASFQMVDGKLVAELGAGAANEWFYAVVHSDPVNLGWFQADASGRVTVPVPSGLPAGAHTLQLYDASGALVAWGSFMVAAVPGTGGLAATGLAAGGIALAMMLASLLTLAGMALVMRRRHGRDGSPA